MLLLLELQELQQEKIRWQFVGIMDGTVGTLPPTIKRFKPQRASFTWAWSKGVPSSLANTAIPFKYNDFEELKNIAQTNSLAAIKISREK